MYHFHAFIYIITSAYTPWLMIVPTCWNLNTHSHTNTHTHKYTHAHTHTNTDTYMICIHMQASTHIDIQSHTCTYIHTHKYNLFTNAHIPSHTQLHRMAYVPICQGTISQFFIGSAEKHILPNTPHNYAYVMNPFLLIIFLVVRT